MLRHKFLASAALALAVSFSAPAFAQEDAIVAKVGEMEIRQSELDLAIANLDPQLQQLPDEQKRVAALSGAIDVKLLAQGAVNEGIRDTEDFKKRMSYITDRELHNSYFRTHVVDAVTEDEVKARYEKEIAALPKQEEVNARHILVKTEEEAKAVIAELDAGKDFAELAKTTSEDSNKSDGGDLGWFAKGRMVPEFEEAAFALEKGAYTKTPVQSQFGFHVIKLEDRRDVQPVGHLAGKVDVRLADDGARTNAPGAVLDHPWKSDANRGNLLQAKPGIDDAAADAVLHQVGDDADRLAVDPDRQRQRRDHLAAEVADHEDHVVGGDLGADDAGRVRGQLQHHARPAAGRGIADVTLVPGRNKSVIQQRTGDGRDCRR